MPIRRLKLRKFKIKSPDRKLSEEKAIRSPETLVATEKIIELAQDAGVDFGVGDAKERIRYFVKLGILPHAVRQESGDQILSKLNPVGHLPYWSLKRLVYCQRLFKKGVSYKKIAGKIKRLEKRRQAQLHEPEIFSKTVKNDRLIVNRIGEQSFGNLDQPWENYKNMLDSVNFLPTEKIIELAQDAGVDFGVGDAKERIRYFVKLGILPHAVRQVSQYQGPNKGKLLGHLPDWSIKRLLYINKLYQNGLPYPQIATRIKTIEAEERLQQVFLQSQTQRQPHLNSPLKTFALVASFVLIVSGTVFVGLKTQSTQKVLGSFTPQNNKIPQTTRDLITFCRNLLR